MCMDNTALFPINTLAWRRIFENFCPHRSPDTKHVRNLSWARKQECESIQVQKLGALAVDPLMRDLGLTACQSEEDSPKAVGKVSTGSKCQFIWKSDIHVGSRDRIPGAHTRPVKVTKPNCQIATGIVWSDLKGKLEKISHYCPMLDMAMTSWARVGYDTMYWSQTRLIADSHWGRQHCYSHSCLIDSWRYWRCCDCCTLPS